QFWIPEGFAHGFIALQDDTHFLYKTTDFYNKDSERCIRWDDPTLKIDWPMVEGRPPIVNDKDAKAPGLGSAASSTGP
ncbi:MAG: dTDP-4-keto-6-deoxy-D-glucose epimerase, partial [Betaproteobacteria bacterium]|nr:dTDP-4-keto-6-deoxy-D-glucose epimerase [Betaproteobacteria bacterium]